MRAGLDHPAFIEHKQTFSQLYSARKLGPALREARAAVETVPILEEPYVWASSLHTELGQDRDGLEYFAGLTRRYPELGLPWFYKGYHEWHLGRLEASLHSFQRAAELDPANPKAFYRQGVVLHRMGRFDEAVSAVRRSRELDPEPADSAALLADVLRFTGAYAEAEQVVVEALRKNADSAKLQRALGQLKLRSEDYDEAERALRRAVELDPIDVSAHQDLSRLLLRTGREGEARREQARAERLGDYARGKRELGTLLSTKAEPSLQILLAELELTEGQLREALLLFRRAESGAGADARIIAGQAEALYRAGRAALADETLARLPADAGARADLARAAGRVAAGDSDAAAMLLEQARRRGPAEREFLRRVADLYAAIGMRSESEAVLAEAADAQRLTAGLQ